MKTSKLILIFAVLGLVISCKNKTSETNRKPILEVEGKFLYADQVEDILPPNINAKDSAEISQRFIQKWITDVLIYENAKRNITNKDEIEELLEDYRKSLTIHQYQQKLIEQRLPKAPSNEDMKAFYDEYSEQFKLSENLIKGILLIVPKTAPQLANVRSWVISGNTASLEKIEKYSIKNAISYDYFGDRWFPFTEILKKLPLQIEDPASFISRNRFVDATDSTRQYFLKIESYKLIGQIEPFEMAKQKISTLIMNKLKSDLIGNFESEIYNDAIKNESVTYFK